MTLSCQGRCKTGTTIGRQVGSLDTAVDLFRETSRQVRDGKCHHLLMRGRSAIACLAAG